MGATIIKFLLNSIFFGITFAVALFIGLTALSIKIHDQEQAKSVTGTLVKEIVPIRTVTDGIVKKIAVKEGQQVKKNDVLVELDNELLRNKEKQLGSYPKDSSAYIEATLAKEQLKNLLIRSPVDGVVGKISAGSGGSVQEQEKIMSLFSNENVYVKVEVTTDNYKKLQKLPQVTAYSERLDKSFVIFPKTIFPEQKTVVADKQTEKTIEVAYLFANGYDIRSLLANEDLQISVVNEQDKSAAEKLLSAVVSWWDGIFQKSNTWLAKVL